jgi:hypothetical protein
MERLQRHPYLSTPVGSVDVDMRWALSGAATKYTWAFWAIWCSIISSRQALVLFPCTRLDIKALLGTLEPWGFRGMKRDENDMTWSHSHSILLYDLALGNEVELGMMKPGVSGTVWVIQRNYIVPLSPFPFRLVLAEPKTSRSMLIMVPRTRKGHSIHPMSTNK